MSSDRGTEDIQAAIYIRKLEKALKNCKKIAEDNDRDSSTVRDDISSLVDRVLEDY